MADMRTTALSGRPVPPGEIPLIECEGTPRECGVMLGGAWRHKLRAEAAKPGTETPWWKEARFKRDIDRLAPHLPDLFLGMAQGAGVDENRVCAHTTEQGGCSAFAFAPSATLDSHPISGQTKDVAVQRGHQFVVLALRIAGGKSALTLTYPGWLFGHGFVRGGTSVFRNSLYVADSDRGVPYELWGLLALHCPTVGDAAELVERHGVRDAFHCTVADEHGGIVGIENGKGGPRFLEPEGGIYVHANNVLSGEAMLRHEKAEGLFSVVDSQHRVDRMRLRFEADRGRLTAQLAYAALCDHENYPVSLCRHQDQRAWTAALVITEPTRGLLHVTRGAPCQNWPKTHRL